MSKFDTLTEVDWSLRRVKELHQDALLKLQQAMSQDDRSMEGYLHVLAKMRNTMPERLARARTSSPCSTRTQQPRQRP